MTTPVYKFAVWLQIATVVRHALVLKFHMLWNPRVCFLCTSTIASQAQFLRMHKFEALL